MKISCDLINDEFIKKLPKGHTVIKYKEFGMNLEGDEEGMFSIFSIVTVDKDNEIHLYEFTYHPSGCDLAESNNGRRWFIKE